LGTREEAYAVFDHNMPESEVFAQQKIIANQKTIGIICDFKTLGKNNQAALIR
jgi:hypothetical protein